MKIDSHVVKAVVARLCDKIEEPKIKKEKEEAERQEREKKAEIALGVYGWNEVFEVLLGSVISQMRKITMTHAIKIIHTWNQINNTISRLISTGLCKQHKFYVAV